MPETLPTAELHDHPQAELIPPMRSGEYAVLVADIGERGVAVPLEVNSRGEVLDGRHRLRAAGELGLESVPVRVVESEDELAYILRAAINHRHLDASQRAALALELDEHRRRREDAQARRLANLRRGPDVATLPHRGERTREIAARSAGVSPRTIQDAETVRLHDPVLFEQVRQGRLPAHVAARRIRQAQRDLTLVSPPLPDGAFELIYADPPWQLGNPTSAYAPENHYPTMALGEIKKLEVPSAEDAVLFLWAVASKLPEALEVMAAWGFEYKTDLVWVKDWIGLGTWVRHRHEPLLLGRRGNYPPPEPEDRPDSVIEAPRGRHSEKPVAAYELIERAYPLASKLELFARGVPRNGWTAWGNEVEAA